MTSNLNHFRDIHYENALDNEYWEQCLDNRNLHALQLFIEQFMKDLLNQKGYTRKARRKFKKAKEFMVNHGIWTLFSEKYGNIIEAEDLQNVSQLSDRHKSRIVTNVVIIEFM